MTWMNCNADFFFFIPVRVCVFVCCFVFTGGTSKMEGVVELAESIFQTSVRLGIPSKFNGMETILQNPIYSTSIGLIEHGNKQINHEMLSEQNIGLFSKLLRIVKSEY